MLSVSDPAFPLPVADVSLELLRDISFSLSWSSKYFFNIFVLCCASSTHSNCHVSRFLRDSITIFVARPDLD